LRPAPRFIHDSSRSPTTLNPASTSIAAIAGMPKSGAKRSLTGVGIERATMASTMP
jgi:hypothetical protein